MYKKRSIMLQNNRDKGTCELHRTISITMKRLEADGIVKVVKKPGISYSHYILKKPNNENRTADPIQDHAFGEPQ